VSLIKEDEDENEMKTKKVEEHKGEKTRKRYAR